MAKEEKRRKIREAAARLFAEKGFENTTTRDIAGAAGINNAALYYYFDNKEQLLYQILEEVIRTGLEKLPRSNSVPGLFRKNWPSSCESIPGGHRFR